MTQEQVMEAYAKTEFAKHFEFQNEEELREAERGCRGHFVGLRIPELTDIYTAPNQIERLFYTIRKLWAERDAAVKALSSVG